MKNIRYLLIVVIYTESLDECGTLKCLKQLDSRYRNVAHLYIHINGRSDFSAEIEEMFRDDFAHLTIWFDGRNRGIVYAYKHAVLDAGKDVRWITLLDQDSSFDGRLFEAINTFETRMHPSDVAVAPLVFDTRNGVQLSPFRVFFGKSLPFSTGIGFPVCINSMTTFRADYLLKLAPSFPIDFFLDAFDCRLFYQMHKSGMQVHIFHDLIMGHNLSLIESDHGDTYWAREIMALINSTKISPAFFPLASMRFFLRLVRASWQDRTLRYFNLLGICQKYRVLIRDLNAGE